ncbi:MAG: CehA/McbA family metallohydrolase, partial [Verrucomicrobiae bacterium]|nr:CehA/McbA family metallohydrolase [Verrucomicrobiae bacterium]
FRIPLAAGTDKMSERIPVGSSRLYVKVEGRHDFDAWIDGVKAGNGFITNGPMLTFSVDGHASGEVLDFKKSRRVTATSTARSLHPFSRLQILVNSRVVAEVRNPTRNEDGIYEASINFPIELAESSWIASRVASTPGVDEAILPRRMTVFAHANPVYFLEDGKPVRVEESIDYLKLYLQYTQHWFRTAANFETPVEKRDALQLTERALEIYQGL